MSAVVLQNAGPGGEGMKRHHQIRKGLRSEIETINASHTWPACRGMSDHALKNAQDAKLGAEALGPRRQLPMRSWRVGSPLNGIRTGMSLDKYQESRAYSGG